MFGILLALTSTAFEEVANSIGKKQVQDRIASYYTFGFLTLLFGTAFLLVEGFVRGQLIFSLASLPTFLPRLALEILQAYVTVRAITYSDRGDFGFFRTLTIPILLGLDILLGYSSVDSKEKVALLEKIDSLAFSGERVLGVASKEIIYTADFSILKDLSLSGLSFDGFITFRDPVRSGIKHAISRVYDAGVKTVIVTGDHKGTAMAVAKEIGMKVDEQSVLDSSELSKLSEQELKARLPNLTVISRVTPFDKLRIAKLYQQMGYTEYVV